jgi:hypothetical protein
MTASHSCRSRASAFCDMTDVLAPDLPVGSPEPAGSAFCGHVGRSGDLGAEYRKEIIARLEASRDARVPAICRLVCGLATCRPLGRSERVAGRAGTLPGHS